MQFQIRDRQHLEGSVTCTTITKKTLNSSDKIIIKASCSRLFWHLRVCSSCFKGFISRATFSEIIWAGASRTVPFPLEVKCAKAANDHIFYLFLHKKKVVKIVTANFRFAADSEAHLILLYLLPGLVGIKNSDIWIRFRASIS